MIKTEQLQLFQRFGASFYISLYTLYTLLYVLLARALTRCLNLINEFFMMLFPFAAVHCFRVYVIFEVSH
jgi:hypothetical protein